MGLNHAFVSEGYVPAYQMSAVPFVTSSSVTTISVVSFPNVTKFFTVQNNSSIPLRVGFTELGVQGNNYFTVRSGSDYTADFKVNCLFLSSSTGSPINFTVLGGLTCIPSSEMLTVTGSNGFDGVG